MSSDRPDPGPDGTTRPGHDPAASMSLLTQLLNNPLDAGYHAYEREESARNSPWLRLLVAVLAVALGLGCTLAVRTLRAPAPDTVGATLVKQAQEQQATVTRLQGEVTTLTQQIRTLSGTSGQSGATDDPGLDLLTAGSAVQGPGVTVTLQDAQDSALDSRTGNGLVRDQDIRVVLNALWSSGAEAIAVNGRRIGPGTFVRTAGSTILVNVSAIQSPYTIDAIGDPDALSLALVRGSTGDYLSTLTSVSGIRVSTSQSKSLGLDRLNPVTTTFAVPTDQNNTGG